MRKRIRQQPSGLYWALVSGPSIVLKDHVAAKAWLFHGQIISLRVKGNPLYLGTTGHHGEGSINPCEFGGETEAKSGSWPAA